MARPRNRGLLLVAAFLLSLLSLASPTAAESSNPSSPSEPLNCSSKFSGDYYGLGVRLGIYFTWLTSWLANTFIEDEIAGGLDANAIFLFALIISIFRATAVHGPEALAYIDGLILMQLCDGYIFSVLSLWGYRTIYYNREGPKAVRYYGQIGTHFRLVLAAAISIYGVWFWAYGIRYDRGYGLHRATDENGILRSKDCYPIYVFFFAKLKVLGGIRILYIITSTSCSVYYVIMLLAAAAERIRHLTQVITKEKGHHTRETFNYETGLTRKELDFLFNLNRAFNLVWIGFSATQVELAIKWNHVIHVLGPNGNIFNPAELIPMLIGVLSLVRICWLIFKQWRDEDRGCCDENQTGGKVDGASGAPDTLNADLGVTPSSPAGADVTDAACDGRYCDASTLAKRSIVIRYTIAYLPWLSQFEFWKTGHRHRPLQNIVRDEGQHYHDSPSAGVQTSCK